MKCEKKYYIEFTKNKDSGGENLNYKFLSTSPEKNDNIEQVVKNVAEAFVGQQCESKLFDIKNNIKSDENNLGTCCLVFILHFNTNRCFTELNELNNKFNNLFFVYGSTQPDQPFVVKIFDEGDPNEYVFTVDNNKTPEGAEEYLKVLIDFFRTERKSLISVNNNKYRIEKINHPDDYGKYTLSDFFNNNHSIDDNHNEIIHFELSEKIQNNFFEVSNNSLDRRRFFFDSCIWFRSSEKGKNTTDEEYIQLDSSKDYRKHIISLFENSKIETNKNFHNKFITPFKFHSETLCFEEYEKNKEELAKYCTDKSWKWKVLIFDDKADSALGNNSNLTKKNRIIELLGLTESNEVKNHYKFNLTKDQFIHLEIDVLTEIPENLYTKKIYTSDIVLLDYLFEVKSDAGNNDYMYIDKSLNDFLAPADNKRNNHHISGKYWFLPISAYNQAFLDKLNLRNINYYGENYIISLGADPICTPNLFRARFTKLLLLQFKELLRKEKPLNELLLEVINKLNPNSQSELEQLFYDIAALIGVFLKISKEQNQTPFTKSALKNMYFDSDVLTIKKVQEFIYLIIFGGIMDFPILTRIYEKISNEDLKKKFGQMLKQKKKINEA